MLEIPCIRHYRDWRGENVFGADNQQGRLQEKEAKMPAPRWKVTLQVTVDGRTLSERDFIVKASGDKEAEDNAKRRLNDQPGYAQYVKTVSIRQL